MRRQVTRAARTILTVTAALSRKGTGAGGMARRIAGRGSGPTILAVSLRHPQHALAASQMRQFGSLFSFEISGGKDAARKVVDGVRLVRTAVSLGGPESLICHPTSSTHVGMPQEAQFESGITDGMLRVSVGLESTADITADLQQALAL